MRKKGSDIAAIINADTPHDTLIQASYPLAGCVYLWHGPINNWLGMRITLSTSAPRLMPANNSLVSTQFRN